MTYTGVSYIAGVPSDDSDSNRRLEVGVGPLSFAGTGPSLAGSSLITSELKLVLSSAFLTSETS